MDKFPEDFNRQICYETMTDNQSTLTKEVRKQFYEKYKKAVNDCDVDVSLEFPEKLWNEHKITIIKELLDRFGKIKVGGSTKMSTTHCDLLKAITNTEDLPPNIKKVVIEFIKA